MYKLTLIAFLSVALSISLNAQFEIVKIYDLNSPEEPTIMMDYTNPARMMAASNISHVFHSLDTGRTWTRMMNNTSQYGLNGDPVLIVDTTGSFYYFHLSGTQNWLDRIVCQRMDTLGTYWATDTYMGLNAPKDQDKEWGTVDRSNNNIYVTWTEFDIYGSSNPDNESRIKFSRSTDRGETWSPAIQINEISGNCVDDDETTEGAVPCVGPNGEIYVSWAGPAGLVFDRSTDQGETWLEQDIFIDSMPGGWAYDIPGIFRANGLPVTKCDTSGGDYHGNIYVNWTDQRNGEDDTDVWIAKSTDGGDTWSEPIRVNDDAPGRHQFFTWMDVDQVTGKLYVIFYDRRNTTGNATDVYMAISEDGGETYENIQISETPFIPESNVFFGDYNNIVAYNGIVRPIWTRLDGTALSIYTALINYEVPNAIGRQTALTQNSLQVYPNPIDGYALASFKTNKPSLVSLAIYNLQGRKEVGIKNNVMYPAGKHIVDFEKEIKKVIPGHYLMVLNIDGERSKTRSIVVE